MKLSSRSRYGLRAILELAVEYGNGPVQIKAIAKKEDISNKYLEQLVAMMKSAGLVTSVRGPKGGYILTKEPDKIKLSEIITSLEGPIDTAECLEHSEFCPMCADCVTREVWGKIQNAMMGVLESTTLQDMAEEMVPIS
jgi:Rrf2 family cysteine metabolism transcriptional repressor